MGDFKMLNIIDIYVNNMHKEDIVTFAKKNDIDLSSDELDFIFDFIKNNYKDIIKNKDSLNLEEYRDRFSNDNYIKIEELLKKYINYI